MPTVNELRLRLVDPARLQELIHEANGEHKEAATAEVNRRIAEARDDRKGRKRVKMYLSVLSNTFVPMF